MCGPVIHCTTAAVAQHNHTTITVSRLTAVPPSISPSCCSCSHHWCSLALIPPLQIVAVLVLARILPPKCQSQIVKPIRGEQQRRRFCVDPRGCCRVEDDPRQRQAASAAVPPSSCPHCRHRCCSAALPPPPLLLLPHHCAAAAVLSRCRAAAAKLPLPLLPPSPSPPLPPHRCPRRHRPLPIIH